IARELIAFNTCQGEWVIGIVDRRAYQRIDAFTNQTGVGTEYEHARLCWIRSCDKAVDVGGFNGGHGAAANFTNPLRNMMQAAIGYCLRFPWRHGFRRRASRARPRSAAPDPGYCTTPVRRFDL